MGTIKFELDLPDFEKEIELKVIINKDGVQKCTSPIKVNHEDSGNTPIWRPNAPIGIDVPTTVTSNPNSSFTTMVTNSNNVSNPSKIPSSMVKNY